MPRVEDLQAKRLKLVLKGLKAVPNSPKQLKFREEIKELTKQIKQALSEATV